MRDEHPIDAVLEKVGLRAVDVAVEHLQRMAAVIAWQDVKKGYPDGECVVLVDTPKGVDVAFYQDCTDFFAFRPMSVESENSDEPDLVVTRWAYLPQRKQK